MGDVELFCLLQGDPLEKSFPVTINREDNVTNLRKLVVAECPDVLKGVVARHILLYCVTIADSSEISQLSLKNTLPLHPRITIGKLFPDGLRKNDYIYIANGMMLRCGLICVFLCSCR